MKSKNLPANRAAINAAKQWWWFEFLEEQGPHLVCMCAPNKQQLATLAKLEEQWGGEILKRAVYVMLNRQDDFGEMRNMWNYFLSKHYCFIPKAAEGPSLREQIARMRVKPIAE